MTATFRFQSSHFLSTRRQPDSVRLNSTTLETEAGTPVLKLNWGIAGSVDPLQTIFVHVSDETGKIVAQADGDLISQLAPLSGWSAGDSIEEQRPLSLPSNLLSGITRSR